MWSASIHSYARNRVREVPAASKGAKAERLQALRQVVASLERRQSTPTLPLLPFGIAELDEHLPGGGLGCGLLHELQAKTHGERPAALGFMCALIASVLHVRPGHALFVAARRSLPF